MTNTKKRFASGLWFDSQAEEAARFYTTLFPQSGIGVITRYGKEGYEIHKQPEGKVMTVTFTLSGHEFMATNGGPLFKFNPSISYYVVAETEAEVNTLWEALSKDGQVLMPLNKYDWSEKYGWTSDRYGLSWQITLGKVSEVGQKITPLYMFVQNAFGRAEEAIRFYTSIFKNSSIDALHKYPAGPNMPEGKVMHARFKLGGETFMAMDGAGNHAFSFNEAISTIVNCATQDEIDYYWNKLTADGGQESHCGWLKDKFGVWWEVVPVQLGDMLTNPDKNKTERVVEAFLKMKKFNIATLEEAFAG
ncbi:VOC family protein [Chryseolinea lacunae]|uniref:VOC family protein n=1 Tax=Chryseolinea lacunae TaxID=2801331 RepID=A0ABS1KNA0_9BACT|nr:VOC family protein [Chryseolinea lacunae]MBL0740935.1 VOC family protein [Chryseolinea lacunae]